MPAGFFPGILWIPKGRIPTCPNGTSNKCSMGHEACNLVEAQYMVEQESSPPGMYETCHKVGELPSLSGAMAEFPKDEQFGMVTSTYSPEN